jgi:hypothetical protein
MPIYISSSREGVAPEGDYSFVVNDANEKESRAGTPMIELQLLINYNGKQLRVYDHLPFTEKAFWKIDQFRESTGEQLVNNQKVNIEAEDCVGRKGRCHLIVDSFEGKNRNKVDGYLPPAVPTGTELGEPEDIPF